jgi:uncharacterized radical SAM superfamily Fe-S cluster-containing enzyme
MSQTHTPDPTAWPPSRPSKRPEGADAVPFDVSPHLADCPVETEGAATLRALAAELVPPSGTRTLALTASLCPACLAAGDYDRMTVPMARFEADGEIRVRKRCPEHGHQSDVEWADADAYRRARRLDDASRHPLLSTGGPDHGDAEGGADGVDPTVAGIGNVTVTNRCDRSCHYCFFYAESGEPLHEPTADAVEEMAAGLGAHDGIGAIQLTGGEPTVREDLPELVERCVDHADEVLVNSHGGRFLREPGLAARVADAGARGLYTSFDGVDPEHNPKNYWEFPHALTACHDVGMCAMLVPTVIDGWNDGQLGDIVRFGAANSDTVCGVNFQPVSFVGRLADEPPEEGRITIPGVMERVEAQTDGAIPTEAWLPLPVLRTISEFKRQWTGDHLYRVTSGFSSWMVTAVAVDGDDLYPLTDLLDVETLVEELVGLVEEFGVDPGRLDKLRVAGRLVANLDDLLGPDTHGLEGRLRTIAADALRTGEFDGLGELFDGMLPVGIRHFQDPYNYDLDRLPESNVRYAMPDGDPVPFSVYNVVPEGYRDRVKAAHSVTVEEWLEREYTALESADDPGRRRRTADVIDAEEGTDPGAGGAADEGVFGADLTHARDYDADRRETVQEAYRASIEDLDPVWSVIGGVVEADVDGGCGTGGCCGTDGSC